MKHKHIRKGKFHIQLWWDTSCFGLGFKIFKDYEKHLKVGFMLTFLWIAFQWYDWKDKPKGLIW